MPMAQDARHKVSWTTVGEGLGHDRGGQPALMIKHARAGVDDMHHDLPQASRMRDAWLVDAALADGRGAMASTQCRQQVLVRLDRLGVHAAVIGYPAVRPADRALLAESRGICRQIIRICATAPEDAEALAGILRDTAATAAAGDPPVGALVECNADPALDRGVAGAADPVGGLGHAVAVLRGIAQVHVVFAALATAAPDRLRAMVQGALLNGARSLILADTTGRMLPVETAAAVAVLRSLAGPDVAVIAAPADDLGLATANALAAIGAGATGVMGAIGGLGERAGLVALEEIATAIRYRPDHTCLVHDIDLALMSEAGQDIAAALAVDLGRNKAVLGDYVFGTAAGLHQHGLLNHPITYEYLDPADFGRERRILIGRHSGRAVLRSRLTEAGINFAPDQLEAVYQAVMRSPDPERFNDNADLVALYRQLAAHDIQGA